MSQAIAPAITVHAPGIVSVAAIAPDGTVKNGVFHCEQGAANFAAKVAAGVTGEAIPNQPWCDCYPVAAFKYPG